MAVQKKKEEAELSTIELVEGKGKRGNNGYDFYWHIFKNGVRAGQVYINYTDDPIIGKHASIQIFLNKKSQGQGIGRIGYKEACIKSGLDTIYAHMRKNNLASRKAAIAAGFQEVKDERFIQFVMVWHKNRA